MLPEIQKGDLAADEHQLSGKGRIYSMYEQKDHIQESCNIQRKIVGKQMVLEKQSLKKLAINEHQEELKAPGNGVWMLLSVENFS